MRVMRLFRAAKLSTVPFLLAALLLAQPAYATPPVFNGNAITATTPQFNLSFYGAKCDDSTDDTAALNAALTAAASQNGGTIVVPSTGHFCLINGALSIPCTIASNTQAPSIRITSQGSAWDRGSTTTPVNGAGLDLRYGGSSNPAKIYATCMGVLEIDHVTLADLGTDHYPFYETTGTTVRIHDVQFIGDPTQTGTAATQDVGLFGSSDGVTLFQGYGSKLWNNTYSHIRRVAILYNAANGITFEDEFIGITSGCNQATIANCAPYYFASNTTPRSGVIIRSPQVETQYYPYIVSCVNFCMGNDFEDLNGYDPTAVNVGYVYFADPSTSKGNRVSIATWSPYSGTFTINTTVAASTASGTQTVTPASMTGITTSTKLLIDPDGSGVQEWVTPSSTTGTTFTATFAYAHGTNIRVLGETPIASGAGYTTNTILGNGMNAEGSTIPWAVTLGGNGSSPITLATGVNVPSGYLSMNGFTGFSTTGDGYFSRNGSAGLIALGGATTSSSLDFGNSTAGQWTFGNAPINFLGNAVKLQSAYLQVGTWSGFTHAGDGYFSRGASSGLIALGGATTNSVLDFGNTTASAWTFSSGRVILPGGLNPNGASGGYVAETFPAGQTVAHPKWLSGTCAVTTPNTACTFPNAFAFSDTSYTCTVTPQGTTAAATSYVATSTTQITIYTGTSATYSYLCLR